MQLKNLFADEDAVSPVIGVILMVAITVILAAVIGAFVLGIGGSQEQVPQAIITFQENSGNLDIKHEGGTNIDYTVLSTQNCNNDPFSGAGGGSGNTFEAGNTVNCGPDTSADASVIWNSPSGDDTQILAENNL